MADTGTGVFRDIKGPIRTMLNGHSSEKGSASKDGMRAASNGSLSHRQILTALVNRQLVINLFQRPFFYLHFLNQGSRQKSTEKHLSFVQEVGIGSSLYLLRGKKFKRLTAGVGGEKMQNQWRAMTVRMISAKSDEATIPTAGDAHTSIRKLKEAAYATFSDQVVTSVKALLQDVSKQDANKRGVELIALFERAGRLACQLQSQHVETSVLLSTQEMDPFSVNSDTMEPHTKMEIEEDDHSWDGKPVDLVITPAILAYGDERGDNYSSFKVWSKAVVWMEGQHATKSRGKGVIPHKAKSSVGPSIRKTGAMRSAIVIADDVEQSTTRTAEEIDEVSKDSGEKRHILQKAGQIEQQAKRTTRSSRNDDEHISSRALQNVSSRDETRKFLEVGIYSNVESSKSMKIDDHQADKTNLSTKELKSPNTESAKGASGEVKAITWEKAGSSKKRDRSDDDYSESMSPRSEKRSG